MGNAPPKMHVTTDAVAVNCLPREGLRIALIQRRNEPFRGFSALPGGFVELDEDLPQACARELHEETGLRPSAMVQVGAWGDPGRDPRGRTVSVVYLAVVRAGEDSAIAGDDAAAVSWHAANALPPLAFDHETIISTAIARLKVLVMSTHLALAFLPDHFHAADLQAGLLALVPPAAAQHVRRRLLASLGVAPGGEGLLRCTQAGYLNPLEGGEPGG